MISLPGLLWLPADLEQANRCSGFCQLCQRGDDPQSLRRLHQRASYNTVDASLWFIHAVFEFLQPAGIGDASTTSCDPRCPPSSTAIARDALHIKMDEADGLITQGDATRSYLDGRQDQRRRLHPAAGKAVEINALWYHALKLMGEEDWPRRSADSFRQAFWISPFRGLADVVDGTPTGSIRARPSLGPIRSSPSACPTAR